MQCLLLTGNLTTPAAVYLPYNRSPVPFGEPIVASGDRKQLSHVLHKQVAQLHEQLRGNEASSQVGVSVQG